MQRHNSYYSLISNILLRRGKAIILYAGINKEIKISSKKQTKVSNRLEGDCHIMVSTDNQIFKHQMSLQRFRELQGDDSRIKKMKSDIIASAHEGKIRGTIRYCGTCNF